MKTLAGWIVGVFGLGFLVGTFYARTAADEEVNPASLESVVGSAPLVDCGSGREAVLAPATVDGKTSVQVKCVSKERERVASTVSTVPAAAPAPPARTTEASVEEKKSRSLKESALIIGGGAGAGAGIGAIAKGKKGAALGAAIGGAAATIYDLATRNKKQ
jgi:hypothetical protein